LYPHCHELELVDYERENDAASAEPRKKFYQMALAKGEKVNQLRDRWAKARNLFFVESTS